MHILKNVLLGSALLPVLFVASLVVSSIVDTTPTVEAQTACGSHYEDNYVLKVNGVRTGVNQDSIPVVYTDYDARSVSLDVSMMADGHDDKTWFLVNGNETGICNESDSCKYSNDNYYFNDGDKFTAKGRAGRKTLWWDTTVECESSIIVRKSDEPENYEIEVDVSGPNRVDVGEREQWYASWDSVEGVISTSDRMYRWIVHDDNGNPIRDTGWRDYNDSGAPFLNHDFDDAGEYSVTVIGRGEDGGDFLAQDSDGMDVIVEEEGDSATLRVRSENPSSGVGMDFAGNSNYRAGQRFETARDFDSSGDIDARIFAEPEADNGNEFSHWRAGDCDTRSGRRCDVRVNEGNTKTIRAVYEEGDFCEANPNHSDCTDDPEPPTGGSGTELRIYSNGASNVPVNIFKEDLYGPDGRTTVRNELSGRVNSDTWITVPRTHDGRTVQGWDGCERTGDGGRSCFIEDISDGETKTLTVNYAYDDGGGGDFCDENPGHPDCTDAPNPPPPTHNNEAGLNVESQGLSGVPINHVDRWQIGDGGRTDSGFYPRYYDDEINGSWIQAPRERSGMQLDGWNGCDRTGDNGRSCYIENISLGETRTFTAVYEPGGGDEGEPEDPTPPSTAVLIVNSENPSSGASLNVLNSDDISDFWTPETFSQSDAITADIWARNTHIGSSGGNPFSHWENCPNEGSNSKLCIVDVSVGESLTITAVYDDAPPPPAEIDGFSLNDPQLDFSANPPELHVKHQSFRLDWETTYANSVSASGDWSGLA